MEGIVTSIRHSQSGLNFYSVLCADDTRIVGGECELKFNLYDVIEVEDVKGNADGVCSFSARFLEAGNRKKYEKYLKDTGSVSRVQSKPQPIGIEKFDEFMGSVSDTLKNSANRLMASIISGSPVVVRYHNDGDGASGAIGLFRAVTGIQSKLFSCKANVIWKANKGVSYSSSSHWSDLLMFNAYESAEKPLVVIVDFGTTKESENAITNSKGVEYIWLDHHPVPAGFPTSPIAFYINPWLHGYDSNVTAGAMACVFSSMLHPVDAKELSYISLISDHSDYAPEDKKLREKALVLDYITSKKFRDEDSAPSSLHPKSMDSVMRDESKIDEIFRSASEQLDEAIKVGVKNAKRYSSLSGVRVVVLDFEHVSMLDYGILPGRYSTKLHDEVSKFIEGDVVLIVYYASNISVRMDKKVSGKIDILKIIEKLGEEHDYVVNGGGHKEAASIRVEYGQTYNALNDLLAELGVKK